MANIKCSQCGGQQLETTDQYRSNIHSHGGMFRLKSLYSTWQCFPFHNGMTNGDLECPECQSLLCVNGRVKAMGEWCKRCGKEIIDDLHECDFPLDEKERKAEELVKLNGMIMKLHNDGLRPGEIGKIVGLNHVAVAARISTAAQNSSATEG